MQVRLKVDSPIDVNYEFVYNSSTATMTGREIKTSVTVADPDDPARLPGRVFLYVCIQRRTTAHPK
jgi:hypothetical protein